MSLNGLQSEFSILGFSHPVSWDEVKKAYHTLVIQHHPDKGGEATQFRKIQEAYETLEKAFSVHTTESSSKFLHNRDPKCNDIHLTLEMSLEDLFHGKTITTLIDYDQICPPCQGRGHLLNAQPQPCPGCRGNNGKGKQTALCDICEGKGEWIHPAQQCRRCHGIKIIKDRKKIIITIPAGLGQNDRLQMHHKGNQYPGKKDGHVFITVHEKKHPTYIRRGNDLFLTRRINLADALSGYAMKVVTLDKQELILQTNSPVLPNSNRRVAGYGMPSRHNPKLRGNLIIQFQVIFPAQICEIDDKEQLGKILKQPTTPLLPNPKFI